MKTIVKASRDPVSRRLASHQTRAFLTSDSVSYAYFQEMGSHTVLTERCINYADELKLIHPYLLLPRAKQAWNHRMIFELSLAHLKMQSKSASLFFGASIRSCGVCEW